MNDFDYPGSAPCADYEFEIAELLDGELSPERARIVSLHVASCVRCRRWRDGYAAVDRELGESLPRPVLPAGFAQRLAARLAAETRPRGATTTLDAAEREYRRALDAARHGWRLPALLNGVAAAAVAISLWIVVARLASQWAIVDDVGAVLPVALNWVLPAVLAGAALVWSLGRRAWSGGLSAG